MGLLLLAAAQRAMNARQVKLLVEAGDRQRCPLVASTGDGVSRLDSPETDSAARVQLGDAEVSKQGPIQRKAPDRAPGNKPGDEGVADLDAVVLHEDAQPCHAQPEEGSENAGAGKPQKAERYELG